MLSFCARQGCRQGSLGDSQAESIIEDVAVVAVGGYGREQQFPTQTSIFFSFCLTASETRT
ncbi:MAG: hypothetical protein ACLRW2_11725 [Parasutterella excrementihominis]